MQHGYVRVAAATPAIEVGDVGYNTGKIISMIGEAQVQGVSLLVFPELCLTGSTCGDLFFQKTLLDAAAQGLLRIRDSVADTLTVVGLPLETPRGVLNCAAVLQGGEILAVIPKATADPRYFLTGGLEDTLELGGQPVPVSGDCLFALSALPAFLLGVEVGSDGASMLPAAARYAAAGATVIACPWAAPTVAGGVDRLHRAVSDQAQRLSVGYVLAAAGDGESSGEGVYTGESVVAEGRQILARARDSAGLVVSELDVSYLRSCRSRRPTAGGETPPIRHIPFSQPLRKTALSRQISPTPFLPQGEARRSRRFDEILRLQAMGLQRRMAHTGAMKLVLGLSGGLDSALAGLAAVGALDRMARPWADLICVTMPGFGTTERTFGSAELLAESLGAELRVVDIRDAVTQHFSDIGHAADNHNVVYENAQARERTQVLMDIANQTGGLVVGTGDFSEMALGWCTFGGDQLSMYGVNASVPKTLARALLAHVRDTCGDETLALVLDDVLDTPVSPELLPAQSGHISQRTEQILGPYALHDFFLYYALGRGFPPDKILRLAEIAFRGTYNRPAILKWLQVFYRRLFSQQFKRTSLPEGAVVGAISLSPRTGLRLPGDATVRLWLDQLEQS